MLFLRSAAQPIRDPGTQPPGAVGAPDILLYMLWVTGVYTGKIYPRSGKMIHGIPQTLCKMQALAVTCMSRTDIACMIARFEHPDRRTSLQPARVCHMHKLHVCIWWTI